jgi:hypothetical protein
MAQANDEKSQIARYEGALWRKNMADGWRRSQIYFCIDKPYFPGHSNQDDPAAAGPHRLPDRQVRQAQRTPEEKQRGASGENSAQ